MLYYKIINGQEKISQCKTIRLENGTWISNPSHEQILNDGWEIYEHPEITPSPKVEPDYEQVIQAIKKMFSTKTEELSDDEALEVAALYPTWASKIGAQINVNERYWYDDKLYKVIQQHVAQEDWSPNISSSLFAEVSIEEWPIWVQPSGSSDSYMVGDKVTYNGLHYISIIDNNVWAPDITGWNLS